MVAVGDMNDQSTDVPPGAQLLGREWLGFDGETASIRFQAHASFTNRHGTIQGGFLAAMLDSATGLGALAALPSTQTVVTKSLNTRFLKAASVGPIIAKARVVSRTERDMIVEADLIDAQDVTVAKATAELRILAKK
ncbi:PaaI family thioesterase [Bradyrhizobium ivorense]|uniref:PaaI family thioesterase n=1 Tax=Bradyrhizobium ivorense TaxID=2511166 RepID=UPI0027E258FA|nr:PaaI family thioesterase [Bradyrhizobium ivorense]